MQQQFLDLVEQSGFNGWTISCAVIQDPFQYFFVGQHRNRLFFFKGLSGLGNLGPRVVELTQLDFD
jgi:hypothetical protein